MAELRPGGQGGGSEQHGPWPSGALAGPGKCSRSLMPCTWCWISAEGDLLHHLILWPGPHARGGLRRDAGPALRAAVHAPSHDGAPRREAGEHPAHQDRAQKGASTATAAPPRPAPPLPAALASSRTASPSTTAPSPSPQGPSFAGQGQQHQHLTGPIPSPQFALATSSPMVETRNEICAGRTLARADECSRGEAGMLQWTGGEPQVHGPGNCEEARSTGKECG